MGPRADAPSRLRAAGRRVHASLPAVLRRRDPLTLVVFTIAVGALAVRLLGLGYRTAHWDEARVAYWMLRYRETGSFAYRPIIHGPFVQHVGRWLFGLFGPSDFIGRLPVAVVGGLLPLSALLFRDHLRTRETIAYAFLLASNSVLLYYSRFLRSDVFVAAFMLTALGLVVRYHDRRAPRYLYGAGIFLVLGVAAKENAMIYIMTWIGGIVLLVDTSLFRPREFGSGRALLEARARDAISRIRAQHTTLARHVGHFVVAAVLCVGVWLLMFAPRGAPVEHYPRPVTRNAVGGVTFWEGVTDPLLLPDLVTNTAGYWQDQYLHWWERAKSGGSEPLLERYPRFATNYVEVLVVYALPTTAFSVFGFVHERYVAADSRNLVLFFGYAGFASVIGYPLGVDIPAAWNVVHAIAVLALPAAVGLGTVFQWGREALRGKHKVKAGLAALILVLAVVNVGVTSVGAVYNNEQAPQRNDLVQFMQPSDDMRPTLQRIERIAARNEGSDVLIYGTTFVKGQRQEAYKPACTGVSGWFELLPVSWYLHASEATVVCARKATALEGPPDEALPIGNARAPGVGAIDGDLPPIVITRERSVSTIRHLVGGYENSTYKLRSRGSETIILIDEEAIEPVRHRKAMLLLTGRKAAGT